MVLTEEFIESLAIDKLSLNKKISDTLNIRLNQIEAVLELFSEDCTVPFIARYRKEKTGNLDETAIRDIEHLHKSLTNLETRRIEITKAIFSQGQLTEELLTNINNCSTQTELEDIYAPYKRKKKTRGMKAIEAGLEPLAEYILVSSSESDITGKANDFLSEEHGILTIEDALQGAMDILAERISQDIENRANIREYIIKHGQLFVTGNKDKDTSVYGMYYDYKEPISTVKPHRILALNRGEAEKELEIKIDFEEESVQSVVLKRYQILNRFHKESILDGLKRLLMPAVLREIRSNFTEEADHHGINLFAANLENLLLQPPIKRTRILSFDPGIRTGTKVTALDENGRYLEDFTFYQHSPAEAKNKISAALAKYNIELIAIGNGTGTYEVQEIVSEVLSEKNISTPFTVVSEDGASVYSASPIAKEEFPDLDVSIRGAISIGRRLLDPLAELVKIDPKSIGVGLYQHDLNQTALGESLDETVESVVNRVGVNVNTASYSLLKYVSGIKLNLAKKIISYRDKNGAFISRMDLLKVSGMGEKTFEQAAGFLKVPESEEKLDNTWVHPENYELAREILQTLSHETPSNTQKEEWCQKYNTGLSTIDEIISEIQKPARDPREDYPGPIMQQGVKVFDDLRIGMTVTGKIKNVVDFGAFVDLGIKETALLHLSEMSDSYIEHPMDIVKAGDIVTTKIIDIDEKRKRISLSMKTQSKNSNSMPKKSEPSSTANTNTFKKDRSSAPNKNSTAKSVKVQKNDHGQVTHNPFADLLNKK
ncbi:MAG: helix-hairpin-helix domain-containing protein [Brevinemataceae bacterium]